MLHAAIEPVRPSPPCTAALTIVTFEPDRFDPLVAQLDRQSIETTVLMPTLFNLRRLAQQPTPVVLLDWPMAADASWSSVRSVADADIAPSVIVMLRIADPISRIVSLEFGADDCVDAGCSERELVARIQAQFRRRRRLRPERRSSLPGPGHERQARFLDWEADFGRRIMWRRGVLHPDFTRQDFDILSIFMRQPKRVVDRDDILDALGIASGERRIRTVDVAISRLRRKLHCGDEDVVRTVRGRGYLFLPDIVWVG